MCQKPFVDRALPGPDGGAYSAPTGPLAGLMGWGPRRGEEGGEWGKGKIGGRMGREGRRQGRKGRGRTKGEWGKGTKEKERGGKGEGNGVGEHGFCLG